MWIMIVWEIADCNEIKRIDRKNWRPKVIFHRFFLDFTVKFTVICVSLFFFNIGSYRFIAHLVSAIIRVFEIHRV